MPDSDDELLALLALDALAVDEQADAELRFGTFPAQLAAVSAALAESVSAEPPPELQHQVLRAAAVRRRPGHPIGAVRPCPADTGFDRTVEELHGLLLSLSPAEWETAAHAEHGTVRELIAHLAGVEQLSVRWLDPDDDVPLLPDHVAATRPVVSELAGTPADEVADRWYRTARAVLEAARSGDADRTVRFHDLATTVDGFLITRTFELWAHAMDIALATGRELPRLDPERMAAMSGRLMAAVPGAMAYRHATVAGTSVRFVLTGPAGGCYTVPLLPGDPLVEPALTIVADTVQLCRLAARRLAAAELAPLVEGPQELADLVLAQLDAFARD